MVLNVPTAGTGTNPQQPPISPPPPTTTTPPTRHHYTGPSTGFPSPTTWLPLPQLWTLLLPSLQFNDTPSEILTIQRAITTVSSTSSVDPRVILAVIIQESAGNVRIRTTNNGV